MKSKYIGKVYEGRWKVVSCIKGKYTLENIYNKRTIELVKTTFLRMNKGETSISKIMCCRANKDRNPRKINVVNIKAARRTTYAIRKERGTL